MEPPDRPLWRNLALSDVWGPALGAAHSARRAVRRWNARGPDNLGSDRASDPAAQQARTRRFHALYREHFDFVFRNLRRLGVREADVDDSLQDVFVVALRRLDTFQEGTHAKAWLFTIALRIASNYRRAQRRCAPIAELAPDLLASRQLGPFDQFTRSEAARVLRAFLDSLDHDKRAIFVMVELEQMTAPEIAQALGVNVNTVYSRLRTARRAFEHAIQRHREVPDDAS